jgi:hypothetical protein
MWDFNSCNTCMHCLCEWFFVAYRGCEVSPMHIILNSKPTPSSKPHTHIPAPFLKSVFLVFWLCSYIIVINKKIFSSVSFTYLIQRTFASTCPKPDSSFLIQEFLFDKNNLHRSYQRDFINIEILMKLKSFFLKPFNWHEIE